MGLSEREQRIFAEIEQQLNDDDPRFVDRARRRSAPGEHRGRRLLLAAGAVVAGFVMLLGIVVSQSLGFAGFALMFVGIVVGARELQSVQGDLGHRVRTLLGRGADDG